MPWKTSNAMDEKLRFVFEYERDEQTMAELCARFGNSVVPTNLARYAAQKSCPHDRPIS
jgi:hypothetical protein